MNDDNGGVGGDSRGGGYWAASSQFEQAVPMSNGIEILCHNLSHSDLVLSVNDHSMSHPNGRIIARPGFSHYREVSRKVVHGIADEQHLSQIPTLNYPKFARQKGNSLGQWVVFVCYPRCSGLFL